MQRGKLTHMLLSRVNGDARRRPSEGLTTKLPIHERRLYKPPEEKVGASERMDERNARS